VTAKAEHRAPRKLHVANSQLSVRQTGAMWDSSGGWTKKSIRPEDSRSVRLHQQPAHIPSLWRRHLCRAPSPGQQRSDFSIPQTAAAHVPCALETSMTIAFPAESWCRLSCFFSQRLVLAACACHARARPAYRLQSPSVPSAPWCLDAAADTRYDSRVRHLCRGVMATTATAMASFPHLPHSLIHR